MALPSHIQLALNAAVATGETTIRSHDGLWLSPLAERAGKVVLWTSPQGNLAVSSFDANGNWIPTVINGTYVSDTLGRNADDLTQQVKDGFAAAVVAPAPAPLAQADLGSIVATPGTGAHSFITVQESFHGTRGGTTGGNADDNDIQGTRFADIIQGGRGSDFIYGNGGDDVIFGNGSSSVAASQYVFNGDYNTFFNYGVDTDGNSVKGWGVAPSGVRGLEVDYDMGYDQNGVTLNDYIDGGAGTDTVYYVLQSGTPSITINKDALGTVQILGDTLVNVEFLKFSTGLGLQSSDGSWTTPFVQVDLSALGYGNTTVNLFISEGESDQIGVTGVSGTNPIEWISFGG